METVPWAGVVCPVTVSDALASLISTDGPLTGVLAGVVMVSFVDLGVIVSVTVPAVVCPAASVAV